MIITPLLKEYERYMVQDLEKSTTTVSIYIRVLRALYNKAIDEGELGRDNYPFGRRRYQIPAARTVKKALNTEELAKLFAAQPSTPEQQKAKDYWFLSYACQGINLKDLAILKQKDLDHNRIIIYRAKTRNTSKADMKAITIYLNDYSNSIIKKYRQQTDKPSDYLFDIISKHQSLEEQQVAIKNFTRYINQHIKKLAEANNLTDQISYQWARHSYATNALRKGAIMEFIQEALGHGNLKTTQNYIAGFDDDTKKEFAKRIMEFNI